MRSPRSRTDGSWWRPAINARAVPLIRRPTRRPAGPVAERAAVESLSALLSKVGRRRRPSELRQGRSHRALGRASSCWGATAPRCSRIEPCSGGTSLARRCAHSAHPPAATRSHAIRRLALGQAPVEAGPVCSLRHRWRESPRAGRVGQHVHDGAAAGGTPRSGAGPGRRRASRVS